MRVQKVSDPLDKMIGRNIRFHRIRRRLSQTALAKRIGVAYQQIQKCENATSRIPASRLVQIARMLDVPVTALLGDGEEALIGKRVPRMMKWGLIPHWAKDDNFCKDLSLCPRGHSVFHE